jgi:hypothetical protein
MTARCRVCGGLLDQNGRCRFSRFSDRAMPLILVLAILGVVAVVVLR